MTSLLCPRCERNYYHAYNSRGPREHPYPALSRADDHSYICEPCGIDEALRDYRGAPTIPVEKWPIPVKGEVSA